MTPPGDPSPETLFADATYDRGAAALQALRVQIGDDTFFTLLRRWVTDNANGNVSTADLVALAERVSGQQLDAFFEAWIYTPSKPGGAYPGSGAQELIGSGAPGGAPPRRASGPPGRAPGDGASRDGPG